MDALLITGWAQAAAGFAGAGAVVYAAHRGAATIHDWLAQRVVERQVLAAERVLTLAHRLRMDFDRIRDPFQSSKELEEAEERRKNAETGTQSKDEGQLRRERASYVVMMRLQNNSENWIELFACLPLAKAYFGEDVETALFEFWETRHRILHAALSYAEPSLKISERRGYEGDLWARFNDARGLPDPVSEAVAGSSKRLEQSLHQILRISTVRGHYKKLRAAS